MSTGSALNDRLEGLLAMVDRVLCWVLGIAMFIMLASSVVQVTARYVLDATVIGPDEIARYMMVGGSFLAIPVLARRRNQIAVDAVAHFLPVGSARVWLNRAIILVELVFLVAFSFFALEVLSSVADSGQFSAGLQIPASWPYSTVVIGSALGAVVMLLMFIQAWVNPDPTGGLDSYLEAEVAHAHTPVADPQVPGVGR